jgi:hypothetical protein
MDATKIAGVALRKGGMVFAAAAGGGTIIIAGPPTGTVLAAIGGGLVVVGAIGGAAYYGWRHARSWSSVAPSSAPSNAQDLTKEGPPGLPDGPM